MTQANRMLQYEEGGPYFRVERCYVRILHGCCRGRFVRFNKCEREREKEQQNAVGTLQYQGSNHFITEGVRYKEGRTMQTAIAIRSFVFQYPKAIALVTLTGNLRTVMPLKAISC